MKPGSNYNQLKKSESHWDEKLLNRESIFTGEKYISETGAHEISPVALQQHLDHGSYSIFTAHNPNAQKLSDKSNAERNAALEADLNAHGAIYHRVKGHYGHPEDSYLIHHTKNVQPHHLEQLAQKYGQESIIHSSRRKNRLVYLSGPNVGMHHKGDGYTRDSRAADYYTHPEGQPNEKFTLHLDFGGLHKSLNQSKTLKSWMAKTTDSQVHTITHKLHFKLVR
jgi:hypothetical protein